MPFVGNTYVQYLKRDSNSALAIFPEGQRQFDGRFKAHMVRTGGFVIAKNTDSDIIPVYHNMTDRINDQKREYNCTGKVYCIFGAPIKTRGREIEEVKREYLESIFRLE